MKIIGLHQPALISMTRMLTLIPTGIIPIRTEILLTLHPQKKQRAFGATLLFGQSRWLVTTPILEHIRILKVVGLHV